MEAVSHIIRLYLLFIIIILSDSYFHSNINKNSFALSLWKYSYSHICHIRGGGLRAVVAGADGVFIPIVCEGRSLPGNQRCFEIERFKWTLRDFSYLLEMRILGNSCPGMRIVGLIETRPMQKIIISTALSATSCLLAALKGRFPPLKAVFFFPLRNVLIHAGREEGRGRKSLSRIVGNRGTQSSSLNVSIHCFVLASIRSSSWLEDVPDPPSTPLKSTASSLLGRI